MSSQPFRIAVISTVYFPGSHTDVIVSRWLEPRPTDPQFGWSSPKTQISSMYVQQQPPNPCPVYPLPPDETPFHEDQDLSIYISERYGIPRFDSIAGALTLGGDTLAVDAVILIGEHGNFPSNEFDQKMYPRKELLDAVLDVFEKSQRSVPVFFDKHLSYDSGHALEMVRRIRKNNVPFFGGSSIPLPEFVPPMTVPEKAQFEEVVAITWAAVEAYLYHSLEIVQSLVGERKGGETGIAQVVAWKGAEVWQALDEGKFSQELLSAAMHAVPEENRLMLEKLQADRSEEVCAFQLTYRDGLKATHLWQKESRKWAVAWKLATGPEICATRPSPGGKEQFFPHFAILDRQIEDFFLSGKPPVSLDRLYLTTTATSACMRALAQRGVPLQTPEITIPVPGA